MSATPSTGAVWAWTAAMLVAATTATAQSNATMPPTEVPTSTVTPSPVPPTPRLGDPAVSKIDDSGRLQLFFAPSCRAFDVAFRKAVGVSVTCVDSASSIPQTEWTTMSKDYVILNIPTGVRVTITESDDVALGRLSITPMIKKSPLPVIAFEPTTFKQLSGLGRLFMQNVHLANPKVTMAIHMRMSEL
ncbi:hypothetical protein ATCC90586_009161 [Pythium insidiosum]|nr:hypothetical protein ATCC90586_009161 [Pythium insidiosum]